MLLKNAYLYAVQDSYTFEASQEQCGFLGANESHDLRISFTLALGLSHS